MLMGLSFEKNKRYDKSNGLEFEKFITTIKGWTKLCRINCYNKSNGPKLEKFNATIKERT
jgi:hypothetical protein